MARYLIPLVLFVILVIFLAIGLGRDPHEVPSPLIGKAAPTFQLPQLKDPGKSFSAQQMRGKVWLLNVWASWCVSCREEHPLLIDYGVYGAPETYLIDRDGVIRFKQVGAVTPEVWERKILPLVKDLNR